MKDFYYTIKGIFIIIVTILMLMLYSDYLEDRREKRELQKEMRQKVDPVLEHLLDIFQQLS